MRIGAGLPGQLGFGFGELADPGHQLGARAGRLGLGGAQPLGQLVVGGDRRVPGGLGAGARGPLISQIPQGGAFVGGRGFGARVGGVGVAVGRRTGVAVGASGSERLGGALLGGGGALLGGRGGVAGQGGALAGSRRHGPEERIRCRDPGAVNRAAWRGSRVPVPV
ncbi:hypothetical protein [Planomonospora sphaerica]|uniref:hypothetical protein n=1 Tax=Planomonospora sphaerica TaxID=161355 RepID=UPI0012904512|nr:hypothetical protein [Planomonospora sphaerica]